MEQFLSGFSVKSHKVFNIVGAIIVAWLWFRVLGNLAVIYAEVPNAVFSSAKLIIAIADTIFYIFVMAKLKTIKEGKENV